MDLIAVTSSQMGWRIFIQVLVILLRKERLLMNCNIRSVACPFPESQVLIIRTLRIMNRKRRVRMRRIVEVKLLSYYRP